MQSATPEQVNIPKLFLERGILLTAEAYAKFLGDAVDLDSINEFLDQIEGTDKVFVTKDDYEDYFYPRFEGNGDKTAGDDDSSNLQWKQRGNAPRESHAVKHFPAKDVAPDIRIITDVAGKGESEGTFEDFYSLFADRYRKLSRIFREHAEFRNYTPIKEARRMELKSNVTVVGMIQDKSYTKNNNLMLEIEDMSGHIKVLISSNKERLMERAKYIVRDEIIAFSGALGEDIIFVNDFEFPDIAVGRQRNQAPDDINAIFTSDIHVGSNEFVDKAFLRFIKWLRQDKGNSRQQELASKVKYIVVCGDVVDGVGIYPNQQKELAITDIYKQYEKTAELLSYVPDWIEIIVSPGNHDATRSGNPQFPIPDTFSHELYEMDNVHMVSNPSFFSLHGVKCLAYHGDSIFDFLSQVPGFHLDDPIAPMTEMLRKRHLAPVYGMGTQIVPEPKDYLCIDEPPDIFQTGHTHMNGNGSYRGTTLINSGGWQAQTSFQKMRNITPDVAKVPIMNLQDHKLVVMNFGD
jgi:DNA polymerase II small subunit